MLVVVVAMPGRAYLGWARESTIKREAISIANCIWNGYTFNRILQNPDTISDSSGDGTATYLQ